MSGLRRLAVVVSVLWVVAWLLMYMADPVFSWVGFSLFGLVPVGLAWGIAWVAVGFRRRSE